MRDADVFLLQAVAENAGEQCIAVRLGKALGFQVAYSPEAPGVTDRGLAILSRFPLRDIRVRALKKFDLHFNSRARFALSAVAETPWGPVRLTDVHLDTRLNATERVEQLETVVQDGGAPSDARVVAGDFNPNPFYWIQRMLPVPAVSSQAWGVYDFMMRHGFRTALPESATTHDLFGMHLDWIWVGGSRAAAAGVVPLEFSDHHAVWTRVEF